MESWHRSCTCGIQIRLPWYLKCRSKAWAGLHAPLREHPSRSCWAGSYRPQWQYVSFSRGYPGWPKHNLPDGITPRWWWRLEPEVEAPENAPTCENLRAHILPHTIVSPCTPIFLLGLRRCSTEMFLMLDFYGNHFRPGWLLVLDGFKAKVDRNYPPGN